MRSLLILAVIGLILVTVLAGCGTDNEGLLPGTTHETAGLTLNVLPDTFLGGADVGDLSLDVTDFGDSLVVDVSATGATNLKAIFFELDYDMSALRPMTVDATDLLGDSGDFISLQVFTEPGVVHYAQILTNPDLRLGYTGDGVLAKVLFKKEPALNTRVVSAVAPPDSPLSAQIVDSDLSTNLSWWYANQGDYDQNQEVNLSDIAPLAVNYLHSIPVFPGVFDVETAFAVIDGDANGEISGSDITPIAVNFQRTAAEFHIYTGADFADYPAGGTLVQILGADGIVPHADGAAGPEGRLRFSIPIGDIDGFDPLTMGYWVFPYDGSALGIESNAVGWENVARPVITLTNDAGLVGDGTSVGTAYEVDDLTDYVFQLIDPVDADVSTNVNTVYDVSDAGAGTIDTTDATLNITDGYTGTFSVSATYNGAPSDDPPVWMMIGGTTPGLFIMPDPTDTDWDVDVTGTGADTSNPYVLGSSPAPNFNWDHSVEFSMVANTESDGSGDVIPNSELTWIAFPPFVIDWSATSGVFTTNMFTSEYFFAQDNVTLENSNNVYVVHQSLPDS